MKRFRFFVKTRVKITPMNKILIFLMVNFLFLTSIYGSIENRGGTTVF